MAINTKYTYDPLYPDSDGKPMADNQEQFDWIQKLQGNLSYLFTRDGRAVVAGDNLIYPEQGNTRLSMAPDVYVALGRPTEPPRGSYKLWEEDGVFPQVVIEVLSPNNTTGEMLVKRAWYERYGALEYYEIDPVAQTVLSLVRQGDGMVPVPEMIGFTSPLLGIQFVWDSGGQMGVVDRDGNPFESMQELRGQLDEDRVRLRNAQSKIRAEGTARRREELRAERAELQAEKEAARAKDAELAKEKLAAKLRELGLDPDTL
jgi:Putative restriction endonuclease